MLGIDWKHAFLSNFKLVVVFVVVTIIIGTIITIIIITIIILSKGPFQFSYSSRAKITGTQKTSLYSTVTELSFHTLISS